MVKAALKAAFFLVKNIVILNYLKNLILFLTRKTDSN